MNTKIKKISVIVYCNGNFEETKNVSLNLKEDFLDDF